jgi:DNA-binding MarR family transcriptional regulator
MSERNSLLKTEIKMRRPFSSLGQEATLGVMRTADVVRRYLGAILAPYCITLPQYNVLRILRGVAPGGLSVSEVQERLIECSPGVTRMMDRLERRGWVRRERQTDDRRVVLCFLTEEGHELTDELRTPIDEADTAVMGGLRDLEQQQLIELMDRVRAHHA